MDRYIGEIRIFPYNLGAPVGWMVCDGRRLAVADYPALHSQIAAAWRPAHLEEDPRYFWLPDFTQRTPVGEGQGQSTGGGPTARLTRRKIGDRGGTVEVALLAQENPNHTHDFWTSSADAVEGHVNGGQVLAKIAGGMYVDPVVPAVPASPGVAAAPSTIRASVQLDPATVGLSGGAPHSNLMPTVCVNFCIAYEGLI